jgi:hypothetical protein
MTASFEPGANLDRQGIAYRALIDRMPNHPKDRHVLAAAVAIEANFLVTENRKDFHLVGTPYQDIAVVDADDFLLTLLAVSRWHQMNLLSALYAQVRDSRSLFTLDALLEGLVRHNGTARFAVQVQSQRDDFVDWPAALVAAIISGDFIPEQALLGHGQLP